MFGLTLALAAIFFSASLFAQSDFSRQAFYKAMASDQKEVINAEMAAVQKAPARDKEAFEGALTMKKASFGGSPSKKLNLFKQGRQKLEAAIKQEPDNAEYRFLRLLVQENAPGFLGYKDDLKNDSEVIRKSYKSLPPEVQDAIADYSKKSKILKNKIS
jgi:hypothetical protein